MKKIYQAIKIILLLAIVLLCTSESYSQKETEQWYFGTMSGLDFSSGSPVPVSTSAVQTNEGTSSISDANGNLLFYTDGVTVWNKLHSPMPNGTGLLGDVSTTQSALIVKKPGSASLYYIFTLPAEGTGNFCYSVVDITLDSGKGDVTTKNTVIKGNVTEKLAAVHHCDGEGIWVTIHEWQNKSFYSYLVSGAGISSPVISNTGRVHMDVHGQMKFNNIGTQLACTRDTVISATNPFNGKANVDLYNFNNQTGVLTYSLTLPLNNWQKSYGLEFSQDNTKLYVDYYDVSGLNGGLSELMQFNLAASNVAASGVVVGTSTDPNYLRAMQLGPDGKIYVCKSISPFITVINSPILLGAASGYTDNAINIDPNSMGNMVMLGLPAFVQSYFNPLFPAIATCNFTTGISSASKNFPVLYYDPSASALKLSNAEAGGTYEMKIYSINGRVLSEFTFVIDDNTASSPMIDISHLQAGMYLANVKTPEGEKQYKFVKQ